MIVFSYQMFRTPLDDEYKNVYDNYTSVSEYLSFLSTYSPAKTVAISVPTISRSVKSINGDIVLPINQFRADEIERNGYNYVSVLASPESTVEPAFYRFYFIQKIESLNDNHDSGLTNYRSCKLFLKYDAWTNNYLDNIKNSDHQQRCTRLSINHITSMNGTQSANVELKTDIRDKSQVNIHQSQIELLGSGILSLGIRLTAEGVTITDDDGTVIPMFSQQYSPVVYFPIEWDFGTTTTKTLTDGKRTITVSGRDGSTGWFNAINIPSLLNDPRVLDAWLTLYGISANKTPNSSGQYQLSGKYDSIVSVDTGTNQFAAVSSPSILEQGTIELSNLVSYPTSNNEYLNKGTDIKVYEEDLSLFPYKGKALMFNGIITPILIPDAAAATYYIIRDNRTTPSMNLSVGLGGFSTKYNLLSSNLRVGKYVDSLEQYLMNNANQIEVKRLQLLSNRMFGKAKMAAGWYGDSLGTIIGGAEQYVNSMISGKMIDAQLEDIDNALDMYSIPAEMGSDSYYFDGVYLISTRITTNAIVNPAFYDYHNNGSVVDDYSTPGAVVKDLFDFMKTVDCNIPSIPIIAHRREIERAFNRGIRKFHIDAHNKQAAFNCEAEYLNPSRMED